MTNNICESIHGLISKNLPNTRVTKSNFRDTINYIIKNNSIKSKNIIRRDFITRTLIIVIEKYELNENFYFIEYDIFKKELENVIAIMTGKINIKSVEELVNTIEFVEIEENGEYNKKKELETELYNSSKKSIKVGENSEFDNSSNSSDEINEELEKSINDNFMMPEKDLENFPDINDNKISHKIKEEVSNNALDDSLNIQDNFNIKEILEDLGDLNLFILDNNFNNIDIKSILLNNNNEDIASLNYRLDNLNIKMKGKKEKGKKYFIQKNKSLILI